MPRRLVVVVPLRPLPPNPPIIIIKPPTNPPTESGQLPPDHPALLSKTYSLSTLPSAALSASAVVGGGGGGGKAPPQGPVGGMGMGPGAGAEVGVGKKKEMDKKTIARIKKLIKYKK